MDNNLQMKEILESPVIDIGTLYDIFTDMDIDDNYREKKFTTYNFNGIPVPRVSEILKECIGKEALMFWAAKLGTKSMFFEKSKAQTIGTKTHERIEHFLLYGEDLKDNTFNYSKYINIAYNNFKEWLKYINFKGIFIEEIIAVEVPISCPYYGGTIDCIARINGKVYIIDFKTSKQISFEYFLQTSAYMWAVNNGFCPDLPHIDGIGIIRIDKEFKGMFEDVFLNEFIPRQNLIIQEYIKTFGALLNSYYHIHNCQIQMANYQKNYRTLGGIS